MNEISQIPEGMFMTTEMRRNMRQLERHLTSARIFFAHLRFETETHPAMYGSAPTDENLNFPLGENGQALHTNQMRLGRTGC